MLEEKDLQAITQLMAQLLTQQKQEIMQDIEQKMARQKQEILAESTHNMQVLIDAEIRPQFNLLAEQIQTMMETRVDTARVERLEDEVSVHKMMIRHQACGRFQPTEMQSPAEVHGTSGRADNTLLC